MDMPYFDMLEGLSPWWWVAFGIALGAIEMVTLSFFLIWPGLAALLMAVILPFAPDMPGEIQVALFAMLSVILTLVGRALMARFGDGGEPVSGLNQRSTQLVGRRAKVISFTGSEGTVEIDGMQWRATGPDGVVPEGSLVTITAADGMMLTVEAPAQT